MICQLGKMNVLTSFVMVILCVNFRRGIVSTYIIIVHHVFTLFLITMFAHTYCDYLNNHWHKKVSLSEEAGDLLQWMLAPNPADRPTLSQVMLHEWVVRGEVQLPTYGGI